MLEKGKGCDLLRINYLCGRITNTMIVMESTPNVVICSELTTFAVESPTIYNAMKNNSSFGFRLQAV